MMTSALLSTLVTLFTTASTVVPPEPSVRLSAEGRVQLELGSLSAPLAGDLVASVRAWALAHGERYGLAPNSTLESSGAFSTRFGASFHLVQVARGTEVYQAKLVVTLDDKGQVAQVSSSLEPVTRVIDVWTLNHDQAMRRAGEAVELTALRVDGVPYGGAKQFLFRVGDELHAGWLVNVQTLDFAKNWYLGVDAVTGEVLFRQNRVHQDKLNANVYPVSPGGLDAGVGATPTVTKRLVFADGGSMVGDTCVTPLDDGGTLEYSNDAGELCGTQLMSFNCCPTEGCDPDAGAHRINTEYSIGADASIKISIPVCERVRRASNVTNPSGDYAYTPIDPPMNKTTVVGTDLANSDAFAEVHSFYHVNNVYEWVRGLSKKAGVLYPNPAIAPFTMRDERRTPARKVAVWSNVMFPDIQEVFSNPLCALSPQGCTISKLARIDNAAFFPRENFQQLPIPGFDTGVDTLMIFQGNAADAAYDATVIQHEFGHGVVYATAAITFDQLALDRTTANNEGGALHEGFADYVAAAFNNQAQVGPYFGPRAIAAANGGVLGVSQDSYLRSMDNTYTCPDVLWGEVHQDSQHVAAALWKGRTNQFAGTDHGDTFDAAFYAMLVSITPNADFAMVAQVMAAKVATAFPSITDANQVMTQIFKDKGVIGCTKVLDLTGATKKRPYYGMPAAAAFRQSLVPGPIQFKLSAPNGAKGLKITGMQPAPAIPFARAPAITTLVGYDAPVTFEVNDAGDSLTNTSAAQGNLTNGSGTVPVDAGCGTTVYVAFATVGGGTSLRNFQVVVDPLASCGSTDAGVDGGVDGGMTADAGPTEVTLPAVRFGEGTPPKGCGCSTGELSLALAALGVLGLRRRRQD